MLEARHLGRRRHLVEVKIYDAVGAQTLRNLGVEYAYLRRRLDTGLKFIDPTGYTVPNVVEKHPVAGDVTSVGLSILAVILGKGHEDYALSLATAAYAQKDGLNKLIKQMFSGQEGDASATWGHLSVIVSVRCGVMQEKANSAYLSNLLLHEVGHAISGNINRDHQTGGVMTPVIPFDDTELSYTSMFKNTINGAPAAGHAGH
jgi:hypothetical protein